MIFVFHSPFNFAKVEKRLSFRFFLRRWQVFEQPVKNLKLEFLGKKLEITGRGPLDK